ncbi:V-type ATP synthase subunit A [Rhodococcus sp. ABRD24]|uniref:V-type ATP synthase subunit A n=1 Tax=Rhodococcus sp. ABRD24 TaxID=2507582 RepID=UPI0010391311|nr:V-type ATP synthase subunit A [Rhodococcus sp. ABRD24]QBJ96273.1 V-type ATP synthase subunit A [Rhodococcus sp. ABRD24]
MTARVVRVSGSLVEVEQLQGVSMFDVVSLGATGLPGEVVAIEDGRVTVQAYEDTGGLAPGAPANSRGGPLSARLGPGLLGGVFDGLLRPLSGAGTWLMSGSAQAAAVDREWDFAPTVEVGASVSGGDEVGVVTYDGPLRLRILVPPGLAGTVGDVAVAGAYVADAVVATVAGRPVTLTATWPVRRARPFQERIDDPENLHTGQRVLDVLYPIARGSTAAVPGGFGTGKTMLLQQIAKWCDADVIVYVGCGERGNEMADVVDELAALSDPRTGHRLSARTVVIANTSNMPMMAREASIYSGVTVAEYFRDLGCHVVVIADSTSRWAEALREFASRTGALPAEEGYPAGLASALAAFYERAGHVVTLGGRRGSVTIVGAVSPSGGDMTEPVTAHTQRFVRCVWTLDRDLAYARHYPAVAWAGSFSRDAEALGLRRAREGDPEWARRRGRVLSLLADAGRLDALADLVGRRSMPAGERVVLLAGRLLREAVLQQSALSASDAFCSAAKGAALVDAVLAVVDRCTERADAGVSADTLEDVDYGPLVRAREDTGPDDADGVRRIRDAVLARLEELR